MDFQSATPAKSRLWFSSRAQAVFSVKVLDRATVVFCLALAALIVTFFWPLVLQINFSQASLAPFWTRVFETIGIESELAVRILFTSSLCFSVIGLYLLARYLTKRQVTPVIAAVAYLIPFVAASYIYLEGNFFIGANGLRSFLAAVYGEEGRMMAITLVPWCLLFFLRYLKEGKARDFVLSAAFVSVMFLAVGPFSFSFITIVGICFLTELFLGGAGIKAKRFAQVILPSQGLVSLWYGFSYWQGNLVFLAGQAASNMKYLFPLPFILAVLTLLFSYVFFSRRQDRQAIFITFLAFFVYLIIVASWLLEGKTVLAYPHRIIPSLGMFGSVVLALSITALFDRMNLERKFVFDKWRGAVQIGGVLVFGASSFFLMSIAAYLVSPLLIKAFSGPHGAWQQVSGQIFVDGQAVLSASDNLKPVGFRMEWQFLSILVTFASLAVVLYLAFRKDTRKV